MNMSEKVVKSFGMAKNSAEHCVVNAAGLFDSLQFRVFHCL